MRLRSWLLPGLALAGFAVAALAVLRGERAIDGRIADVSDVAVERTAYPTPAALPFESYIAGTGVVEAGSGNIAVGTPVSGIVAEVQVTWGQAVRPGDPLFRIDDRELRAKLTTAAARVGEAEARMAQATYEAELADKLHGQHVLSDEQYRSRRFELQIDRAALATARAEVAQIREDIERREVRAVVAGRVLQINTHPGEFADSGPVATPLMVIGDDQRLRVRVDIDQNDASRLRPDAPAIAFVRGAPGLKAQLRFESVEPYVVPKRALSGDTAERIDTRVLQAIYSVDRTALPVYVGQQLDVYIRAADARSDRP